MFSQTLIWVVDFAPDPENSPSRRLIGAFYSLSDAQVLFNSLPVVLRPSLMAVELIPPYRAAKHLSDFLSLGVSGKDD